MRRPAPVAAAAARAADRDRAAVPADRVHRRRRVRAAAGEDARGWSTTRSAPSSRPARPRRCSSWPAPGSAGARRREDYARRLAALDGVASVSPPEQAGGYWIYDVVPEGAALSELREGARARRARRSTCRSRSQVGGETAGFLDQQTSLGDSLPLALAILATTTLVILFAMTGSVVLPVKALVMNLLTVSAAFGLLVLIFQDGRLRGPARLRLARARWRRPSPCCCSASPSGSRPTTACSCSRASRRRATAALGERESVAVGLERTGRIVTYAALLFCIAIGAFATSEVVFIKEVGVGTALAVLIDAFLVRALLVPSLMALLGPLELVGAAAAGAAARADGAAGGVTLSTPTRRSTRVGEGRWRGEVSEAWWIERGPFGGYLSAFLVRAMHGRARRPAAAAALADRALRRRAAGRADRGRGDRRARRALEHGAEPAARAGRAGRSRWRSPAPPPGATASRSGPTSRRPPRRRPRTARPVPRVEGAPRFQERFDLRWVEGGCPGPAGRARAPPGVDAPAGGRPARPPGGDRDVRRLDAGGVLQARAGSRSSRPSTSRSTSARRCPRRASGCWPSTARAFSAGGAWEEDGELWAQDGTLVAQSRQLAMMRERRR